MISPTTRRGRFAATVLLLLLMVVAALGCEDPVGVGGPTFQLPDAFTFNIDAAPSDGPVSNSAKDITQFTINGVNGAISGTSITLTLPFGTNVSNLTPTITITGASVSPASGVARDFTNPVNYTVSGADGTTKTYTVQVGVAPNSAKDITGFSILGVSGAINGTNISLTLPSGTSLTNLTPTITITGVSVSPATGVAKDFTSPVAYTVTAADGSTKVYTVIVSAAASSAKDITQFTILGVDGSISSTSIALTLPFNTNVTSLVPTITIDGASVSPATGVARDFTNPVTYTVTAADGTTKVYTVTVSVAPSSAKEITELAILGVSANIAGTDIALTLPFGTDLTSLTPTITITGVSVSPASGVARDFTKPVTYTVTAADNSTSVYTVTVGVAPSTSKDITQFTILAVDGTINGTNIALTVPNNTSLLSLTPAIAITGTSVSPPSGVPQDFTNPVTYTVTAADNSTKAYTVTVTVAPSSAKDITQFTILGENGTINGTNISLTLPAGTPGVTNLIPTITITGASVSPVSNVAQNFTNPVTYTVTAADGSTKAYTVTVTVAASLITAIAGTPQSASVNTAFATNLKANVHDASGNPVANVTVTFTAPAAGASGLFGAQITTTAITNASGDATASVFTANATLGSYSVIASIPGGATASFSLTNTVGTATSIVANAGTPQSATVNTSFATNLQAIARDALGNPVPGVTVTFTAPAAGVSGLFGASNVTTATTNASGIATASTFTANTIAGSYSVIAGIPSGATASFSLTNTPGNAASIVANAGTPQSATVNTTFATNLQAIVRDTFSNPVSGVTVTFTAPGAGGASGLFGASNVVTATTNASGVATASAFTANTAAGSYSVVASIPAGATASFSLTNTAGGATSITATAGTPQSATVTTTFATNLQAIVRDTFSNVVSGVTVTFTAPAAGGASGLFGASNVTTATTNASGVATASSFTANAIAGSYTVSGAIPSGATTSFSLTNTAPYVITTFAGTPQSATVNTTFATILQASVHDAAGSPVPNVTVTFTAPGAGASGLFGGASNVATATTNASGVATAPAFTANTTAGSYSVIASIPGNGATFSLTNTPSGATLISATAGTPQSATVNTAFVTNLQATVRDTFGNTVPGVLVTFTAPATGVSGAFPTGGNTTTATTNALGVATAATFTANTVTGSYSVVASIPAGATANFSLTNTAGAAASINASAGTPQSAAINTTFATSFQAIVRDAFGNVVPGVIVTFTAPTGGASGLFGASATTTATTNAAGVATASAFTANGTVGSYRVAATIPSGATTGFSLTNF